MLATSDVIAFASTTDLARARSFYGATLGLPIVDENEYACVFDANGTMLRITAVAEVALPGYTVLGWRVTDIGETVARLESLGVTYRSLRRHGARRPRRVDNTERRSHRLVHRSRWERTVTHRVPLTARQLKQSLAAIRAVIVPPEDR